MDCSDVLQRLDKLALGDLYSTEAARVMLHLKRCYTCREEYEEITELLTDCRVALRHPRPVDRFDEILERIACEQRLTEARSVAKCGKATGVVVLADWSKRAARVLVAAAAAAVLVVSVGPRSNKTLSEMPHLRPAVLESHNGSLLEPASAASSALAAHRCTVERYLALSSVVDDTAAHPKAAVTPAPGAAQAESPERITGE